MSLTPETEHRLQRALEREKTYQPNSRVQRELGSRSLVMIVAPAAMGKTFLMQSILRQDERFGMSATLSTREPRADDNPKLFRLVKHTDENLQTILGKIEHGDLVQYAIHPSEHTFYGSELEDHPYKHNMLATLSGGVEQLLHVGFANTTIIGLVAPPSDWSKWFNQRYPAADPKRLGRLHEAERSYKDLLARDDVHWVINREGYVDEATHSTIAAVDGVYEPNEEALAYIQRIRQMIADAKQAASYTENYE